VRYDSVIVGNSAASVGAIEAIARTSGNTSTCLVAEENNPPYSRPFIGHLVSGEMTLDGIWYRPRTFYEENDVDFQGGRKAIAIHIGGREVELDDGSRIGFRRLLLATGGSPILPPIPGLAEFSHTFATLADALDIKARLDRGEVTSAVVLGGGLIGTAATSAFVRRRVHVTVVELAPRILSSVLDAKASAIVQKDLNEHNVRVMTGHTIASVEGSRENPRVTLDNGEVIDSQLLIVAIGVRPRVELARGSGIQVDRGIVVNDEMMTDVPGIFAAGDCAQMPDFVHADKRVLAIWPAAYVGGMIAGCNMAGGRASTRWFTSMNSMNILGRSVLSAGIVNPGDADGWSELESEADGSYQRIVTQDGVIRGFVLVGGNGRAGLYLQMMRSKTPVKRLDSELLSDSFGLAHLPRRERQRMWKEAGKVVGS